MAKHLPTLVLAALTAAAPLHAYTPGSGSVYSDDFEAGIDPDWEMGNGFGSPSPWERRLDGADFALYADGLGPFASSPTRHWARRPLHPTAAISFSLAFEYRGEQGPGYHFFTDVEQRAPALRKYRLRISGTGAVSLWRSEQGTMIEMAATGDGAVPAGQKRWLRFAIEPGPDGHPWVRARVWSGGAMAEPSSGWTVEFLDDLDTLERVHRMEIEADGPKGVETWFDDLDVFGDPGDGVASSVEHIYIAELSHLDIGFTEPPDDIEAFAKTHLDQVLDNLDADPDYRWCIESGWWLDRWWERSGEAQRDRMIASLRSGRLTLAAGYADQTTTMLGHEELIRNLYYGSRMAREHGFALRTWVQDDVPGSTFALPEVLARSGIDYYVGGMNTGFGGRLNEPDHGDRPFWWVGPDGSRVLAWITFDSYAEAFQYGFSFFDTLADLYDKLGKKLPEQEEAGYPYPELMLLRGFDNHYQGFHARNLAEQWNATYRTPVFHLTTPEAFLDMMVARYGAGTFPSYEGDFGAAWARSRAATPHSRRMVRQAHRDARAGEAAVAAGMAVDGEPEPREQIDRTYLEMLQWDEHSGAGGWPGYFTPEEMDRNNRIHLGYARAAADAAAAVLEDGLERMVAELPASGDAVVAINTLGRPRDGWTRVTVPPALYDIAFRLVDRAAGVEVPYQRFDASREILFRAEQVPAVGYRVYDLVPGEPTASPGGLLQAGPTTLENDFYVVTIDSTDGSVSSLIEKATGRDLVDPGSAFDFNELASNTKSQYDTQGPPVADPPSTAEVVLEIDGPLLAALRVTRGGTPHVETTYRLYRGEDRVEIENVLDRDLVPYVPHSTSVVAYTVTMPFDIHDFEIRTETTTRFLDPIGDGFDRASVFDYHNAEHSIALYDTAGGVVLAVDAVSAHHLENLSSLASTSYSTGDALVLSRLYDRSDEYEFDGGSIGPYTTEPDTPPILRFIHHLRATPAAFDPVAVSRFGFEALTPLETRLLSRRPGNLPDDVAGFFAVDPGGVLPYTAKPADVGDGIVLRLLELTGVPTTARVSSDVLTLSAPVRVEHDEEGGDPLAIDGDGFLVELQPFETATVRFLASPAWAPIDLRVDKNTTAGSVSLSWSGGVSPFTLERANDPAFTSGGATLVDEEPVHAHDDPVLEDGGTYYYVVR